MINLKSTDRNGPVVAALQVREDSDVMIITGHGKVIRVHAGEIREAGRGTQGVRLLRLDDGDRVAAAASILEEEEEAAVAGVTTDKPEPKSPGREKITRPAKLVARNRMGKIFGKCANCGDPMIGGKQDGDLKFCS